jgi:predicted nucleic acid-binding protein
MNKVVLDTNILIYAIDEESEYFQAAQNLLRNNELVFYTTIKNISEFISVITRAPKNSLSLDEALLVVADYRQIATVLYPDESSLQIFLRLLSKYKPIGLQIHDFEIAAIALANHLNRVCTVNKKDFARIEEIELVTL